MPCLSFSCSPPGFSRSSSRKCMNCGPVSGSPSTRPCRNLLVCEEDPHLPELVRYSHLNPLRAGLVEDLAALDSYPWSGHPALLGKGAFPVLQGEAGGEKAVPDLHGRRYRSGKAGRSGRWTKDSRGWDESQGRRFIRPEDTGKLRIRGGLAGTAGTGIEISVTFGDRGNRNEGMQPPRPGT